MTPRARFQAIDRYARIDKLVTDAYHNGGRPSAALWITYREAWDQLPQAVQKWIVRP